MVQELNVILIINKGDSMKELLILNEEQQEMVAEYMPTDSVLIKIADFFSSFSDPTRIKILTALCISEMCVNDLAIVLNMNQTTISHQLKLLKDSGVVCSTRFGKIMYYKLCDESVNNILSGGIDYLLAN